MGWGDNRINLYKLDPSTFVIGIMLIKHTHRDAQMQTHKCTHMHKHTHKHTKPSIKMIFS